MHNDRRLWRKILAADIGLSMVAVFFFAWLPPSTLNVYELVIMGGSLFAGVGVVTHAVARIHLPYEHWAYMAAGLVALLTLVVYETRTLGSGIPLSVRVPFGMFLLACSVSAFAAHVIDGGTPHREIS